jgi:3-isopropylmalate dehydrogenase
MLLRHSLALEAEALAIEDAVASTIAAGVRTADIGGDASTARMGAAIREHLEDGLVDKDVIGYLADHKSY